MDNQTAKLKQEIREAFFDVPYPQGNNIISHRCYECDRLKEAFKGKHWKELLDKPLEDLHLIGSGTSLFTPEAYRFYLPLFLFICIERFKEADLFVDSVVFSLQDPLLKLKETPEDIAEMKRLFTPDEFKKYMQLIRKTYPDISDDIKKLEKAINPSQVFESLNKQLHDSKQFKWSVENYNERMGGLNDIQINVIVSFLNYLKEEHSNEKLFCEDVNIALVSLSAFQKRRQKRRDL